MNYSTKTLFIAVTIALRKKIIKNRPPLSGGQWQQRIVIKVFLLKKIKIKILNKIKFLNLNKILSPLQPRTGSLWNSTHLHLDETFHFFFFSRLNFFVRPLFVLLIYSSPPWWNTLFLVCLFVCFIKLNLIIWSYLLIW